MLLILLCNPIALTNPQDRHHSWAYSKNRPEWGSRTKAQSKWPIIIQKVSSKNENLIWKSLFPSQCIHSSVDRTDGYILLLSREDLLSPDGSVAHDMEKEKPKGHGRL